VLVLGISQIKLELELDSSVSIHFRHLAFANQILVLHDFKYE
jgi:hypothetical protein